MESLKTVTATVMTVCFWWIGRMAVWHKIETHEGWTQPGIFNQIWMHSSQQSTTPNSMKQLSQTIAFNLAKSGQCLCVTKKQKKSSTSIQLRISGFSGPFGWSRHIPSPLANSKPWEFPGCSTSGSPGRTGSKLDPPPVIALSRAISASNASKEVILASRGTRGFFWLEKNNRVTKKVKLGWCVCFFFVGVGGVLGWWFWLVPSEASKNGFQKANFHLSRGNSQLPKKKGQQTEHYRNSGDLWPTLNSWDGFSQGYAI